MNTTEDVLTSELALQLERASDLRHDLRNRLSSIRYATFYVQRRLETTELWKSDPRMQRFFEVLTKEIGAASDLIARVTVPYVLAGIEPEPESESEPLPQETEAK